MMTRPQTLKLCVTLLASLIMMPVMAESKIAVMNYEAVLFNSQAANDATLELRTSLAPEQKRLQDIKLQFETRQSRLTTDRDILTEEEVAQFQKELQTLAGEQQQISARMQQVQQESRNAFVQQYQPVIRELVSALVKSEGYTMVIDSKAVLWNENEPDLTDQILEQFDAQYTKQQSATTTNP